MGKSSIIMVLGSLVIFVLANFDSVSRLNDSTTNSVDYYSSHFARNICNSTVEMLLAKIGNNHDFRQETEKTISVFGGSATYTVTEVANASSGSSSWSGGGSGGGGSSVEDHSSDDHEEDHEDDHEEDDHGSDDHGDDHSLLNNNAVEINYASFLDLNFSTSFYENDDHEDDHEGDDHEDDDHGDDDHGEDDHSSDDHDSGGSGDSGGGSGYTSRETPTFESTMVKISVRGTYTGRSHSVLVYATFPEKGYIPAAVKGALSTRNNIKTLGNLVIDGRNYKTDGSMVQNAGTYGVWTTSSYTQSGNSKVGGTYSSSDIAPSKPGNSNVIVTSGTYDGGYPSNPDRVLGGESLGFPDGKLKSIATSGTNGSQYVTSGRDLSYPLRNVTYVELSSGSKWQNANISGSGILIVHNNSNNAILKNVNSGTFKGLIIVDDLIHLHTTVYGAIVGLTESPSSGNTIGNGNGNLYYSSQAIREGVGAISLVSSGEDYGLGKHRLKIVRWYE